MDYMVLLSSTILSSTGTVMLHLPVVGQSVELYRTSTVFYRVILLLEY